MEQRLDRGFTSYLPERSRAFLGKQKARDKKSMTLKRSLIWAIRICLLTTICICVGIGIYLVRDFLLHSPRFDLAVKEIHGFRNVPENHILIKLAAVENQTRNLFSLDLDELRRSLELISWVKAATVRRVLPDKLIIEVSERVPIGYARIDHSTFLVDDEVVLMEMNTESSRDFDFPVITGLESGLEPEVIARNKKRISLYKELIQALDSNGAGLSRDLSEVHVQDPGSLAVLLNDDPVLVVLGSEQLEKRFRRYLGMSSQIKQKCPQVDTVDLRFQDQVIIRQASQNLISASSQ